MEARALIGKNVESILVYPSGPIHPAWVSSELTPSINSSAVFLKLTDCSLLCINPCEVELLGERYPSLGIQLVACDSTSMNVADGRVIDAVPVEELAGLFPQKM